MIQNEQEYEVTVSKCADLQRALEIKASQPRPAEVPEVIWRAHQNGIVALMGDLRAELDEYERLKTGVVRALPLPSVLSDLPGGLVRARIARGWSHNDLAQALGTTRQQVQKDESDGYARASLERLQQVATALGVEIAGRIRLARVARRPSRR